MVNGVQKETKERREREGEKKLIKSNGGLNIFTRGEGVEGKEHEGAGSMGCKKMNPSEGSAEGRRKGVR